MLILNRHHVYDPIRGNDSMHRQSPGWTRIKQLLDDEEADPEKRALAFEVAALYESMGDLCDEVNRLDQEVRHLKQYYGNVA
jgi:hypothetical protein